MGGECLLIRKKRGRGHSLSSDPRLSFITHHYVAPYMVLLGISRELSGSY